MTDQPDETATEHIAENELDPVRQEATDAELTLVPMPDQPTPEVIAERMLYGTELGATDRVTQAEPTEIADEMLYGTETSVSDEGTSDDLAS